MVKRKASPSPVKKKASLLPLLVSRLASSSTDFFTGQEENVAYLLDMLTRTVEKVSTGQFILLYAV